MKPCPAKWQQVAEWVLRLLSIDSNTGRKLGAGRFYAGLSGKKSGIWRKSACAECCGWFGGAQWFKAENSGQVKLRTAINCTVFYKNVYVLFCKKTFQATNISIFMGHSLPSGNLATFKLKQRPLQLWSHNINVCSASDDLTKSMPPG